MGDLGDALESVDRRRKRLEVYSDDRETAEEVKQQFSTHNVDVDIRDRPVLGDPGFVIVWSEGGTFQGGLGLDHFEAMLSPEIHPPWELAASDVGTSELFDFLENTVFSSYDRRQMLYAAREIEERAWRTGRGSLFVGFQREKAFSAESDVYERLATRGDLSVTAFVRDEWSGGLDDVRVVSESDGEIGSFWFVIFDGGGNELQACALLAEEREPDRYYGFWTYEPATVESLVDYLESTYLEG